VTTARWGGELEPIGKERGENNVIFGLRGRKILETIEESNVIRRYGAQNKGDENEKKIKAKPCEIFFIFAGWNYVCEFWVVLNQIYTKHAKNETCQNN